jgi:RNA polymerase sigma-70 factor (ECF subfamily)
MAVDIGVLLRRIGQGDETALAALYAEYSGQVYSLALYVLRNPVLAQEVVQDTFLKLWQNPAAYAPERGEFGSWLLTVARYTAIDRLRREVRRAGRDSVLPDTLATEAGDEAVEARLVGEHLRTLLAHLSQEQRQVVELAYFYGLTHSELAQQLALPLGTVKTRLRLALQKLKELVKRQSFE